RTYASAKKATRSHRFPSTFCRGVGATGLGLPMGQNVRTSYWPGEQSAAERSHSAVPPWKIVCCASTVRSNMLLSGFARPVRQYTPSSGFVTIEKPSRENVDGSQSAPALIWATADFDVGAIRSETRRTAAPPSGVTASTTTPTASASAPVPTIRLPLIGQTP